MMEKFVFFHAHPKKNTTEYFSTYFSFTKALSHTAKFSIFISFSLELSDVEKISILAALGSGELKESSSQTSNFFR